ncbi:nuclear transport factor 2 family protein [Nocardia sp. NPDC050712]|uniref:nuclear transport factor 2 family protein n=1 Tax=Nocardia sp. NPDC050712 TaxID=3155518 RepID=UPI00340ACB6E
MFRRMVKRRILKTFDEVSAGNYQAVIDRFGPDPAHWFAGDHTLGGSRDNLADIETWYARWARLLPDLKFDVTDVLVSGSPRSTAVVVEWVQTGETPGVGPYFNTGVHLIKLRWGRTVSQRVHCDTAAFSEFLRRLRDSGVPEAVAAPIGTPPPPRPDLHRNAG